MSKFGNSNVYSVDGNDYANCGGCEGREHCPIFIMDVFPKVQEHLSLNEAPAALKKATELRDITRDYSDGGVVSYLDAVVEGIVDPVHQPLDSQESAMEFALIASILGDSN